MHVDLNADLGEGVTDDAGLLAVVTSANVACGYHAGDAATMARTCRAAAARGVVVGAHVSHLDRDGFGRRPLRVVPTLVGEQVLHQAAGLDGLARAAGTAVRYLKPHGALYHQADAEPELAAAVAGACAALGAGLLGPPGGALLAAAAAAGVPAWPEGYLDRAYDPTGHLVPRDRPGAVLADPSAVAARAVDIATGRPVDAVGGGTLVLRVRSLCVHGDSPGAVDAARRARAALEGAGVVVAAFAAG